MNLPKNAKKIISLLIDNGYKAYAVGGCVRDYLMGVDCADVDITTSATPQQVESVLKTNKIDYIETGIKHGTVTAVIDHVPFEITTFRTDGIYIDNRHPENICYVTELSSDLKRRDFTINSIAYNDNEGIVDLYNGIDDIKNKIIKTVGNPDERFNEDALRIMRAVRFASVLQFDIEPSTEKAIFDNVDLLNNIAVERVFQELKKLLLGDGVEKVLFDFKPLFTAVIPELLPCVDFEQNTKWHLYDVYTHTAKSVALAPKKDYIRFALLLHDIGKPYCLKIDERGVDHFKGHPQKSAELAERVLKRLKAPNQLIKKAVMLISIHDDFITENPVDIKHWLNRLGEEMTLDYIDVKIADLKSHNLTYSQSEINELYKIKNDTLKIIASKEPYKISHLAINGDVLVKMGFKGREISEKLNMLLESVIQNPQLNTVENLIELISN